MQELVKKGKARAIGVSNLGLQDVQELLPYSKEIPISCNQVEMHAWLPQNELLEFHKKHGIVTTAFGPFGGGSITGVRVIDDAEIQKLAERAGMGIGQMLQSWAVQRGTIPVGKSATPERMRSNLDVKRLAEWDGEAGGGEVAGHQSGLRCAVLRVMGRPVVGTQLWRGLRLSSSCEDYHTACVQVVVLRFFGAMQCVWCGGLRTPRLDRGRALEVGWVVMACK